MTRVATIVATIEPATAGTTGGEIYERFEAEPDTMAIAVVDDDLAPIGLIERSRFMLAMGSAYGRPLYGGRSVTMIMDPDPLLVDQQTLISDFTNDALAERPSDLLRGFVVASQGRYVGVGSALSLLQAAHEQSRRQACTLAHLHQAAARDQSRWSMLFHQSPLAQLCYDASDLYRLLHTAEGDPRSLGERMRQKGMTLGALFDRIVLREANDAALALFGASDLRGKLLSYFNENYLADLTEAANAVTPDGAFPPFDAQIVQLQGAVVDVRVHIRTLPGGDSPWSTCIATFVDMTEVQRAARAQREATQAAEAANSAKTQFLATMSHEIRTPLNGVLGMAQVMEGDALSTDQRERIGIIRRSGESLLSILNDILDLSKIEAGMLDLERIRFDLADTVDGASAPFAEMARSKGLEFNLDIAADIQGAFLGDPGRVRQIIANLLSNAVKFTDVGGIQLAIATAGEEVRLVVSDTGAGIPPDRLANIFDKFVQADASTTRRFGGTGLGLAIIREITQAMGGSLSVDSRLGEGSVFTVGLPLLRCGTIAEPGERVASVAAPTGGTGRALRVLAAEDNPVNQLVLKTLLEQFGVQPVIVGSGLDAFQSWERQDWDLILMDIQMPVMDGPTAARKIRACERALGRAATPIIALTANAMTHQVDEYLAAGMDGFVAKPIQIARLYEVIDQYADRATVVQDVAEAAA